MHGKLPSLSIFRVCGVLGYTKYPHSGRWLDVNCRVDALGYAAINDVVLKLSTAKGTVAANVLAEQLVTGVKAQGLLAAGNADGALALLGDLEIEGWYELTFVSPYYAGALERFTLAKLCEDADPELCDVVETRYGSRK